MTDQTLEVLTQEQLVYKQTRLYSDKLNQLIYEEGGERDFLILEGRKYLKITHNEGAFAFVDRETGDVFKPASWRKPAKGVRYNLLHEGSLKALFSALDLFGGHLYLQDAVAAHIKVGSDIKEVIK
jgi:hypothetical protein